jgi:hypothetical protein
MFNMSWTQCGPASSCTLDLQNACTTPRSTQNTSGSWGTPTAPNLLQTHRNTQKHPPLLNCASPCPKGIPPPGQACMCTQAVPLSIDKYPPVNAARYHVDSMCSGLKLYPGSSGCTAPRSTPNTSGSQPQVSQADVKLACSAAASSD